MLYKEVSILPRSAKGARCVKSPDKSFVLWFVNFPPVAAATGGKTDMRISTCASCLPTLLHTEEIGNDQRARAKFSMQ